MKIEVGLGGVWNEEEKATVVEVLGRGAFDYLVANSISNENLLTAVGSGQNLKNKLSDFVERRTSVGTTSSSEMFFLASMYFSFPWGLGGLGKCFASGKHLWISDMFKSGFDYCVRSFLAKSTGN
ncbi:hypothetical protein GLYMA_20G003000v4 [Glycine max]|uniref:Transcription factor n=1 Tax=Glycine max TaxID=3847 RepID=K7N0J6_SOYBN|nr:hypothetical protein JHK87_054893 [Glycine soja]KAH1033888.1 hypothetical protein GYH30_054343 [Glycine max]KRG89128.1 hypothetical protein GLYMA_20G003000v4 [Glycine max]